MYLLNHKNIYGFVKTVHKLEQSFKQGIPQNWVLSTHQSSFMLVRSAEIMTTMMIIIFYDNKKQNNNNNNNNE